MIHITLVVPWSLIIEHYSSLLRKLTSRDGNGAGRGQRMKSSPPPCMVLFYPIPTPSLSCMMGEIFLPYPRPLEPHEAPSHPAKLYFLLICPQFLIFFLIKPISLIKIYLKLQINLSHQIKLIFSKYWIILSNCLTRHYHNKNKNIIVQNQWFNGI